MSIQTQLYTFLTYEMSFDIPLYVENAKSFIDPHVLELGVGLGRTILPILHEDIPCTGIEKERDFFGALQEYVQSQEIQKLNLHLGYMERFLFEQQFSSIHIPLRTFQLLIESKDRSRCIKNMKKHLRDDGNILIHIGQPAVRDSIWRTVHIAPMIENGNMLIEECVQDIDGSKVRLLQRFQQYHKDGYCTGTYLVHHDLILLSQEQICNEMNKHGLSLQKKHDIDRLNSLYYFQHEE